MTELASYGVPQSQEHVFRKFFVMNAMSRLVTAGTHLTEWYEPFNLKVASSAIGFTFGADQNIIEQKQMSELSMAIELHHEHVAHDVTQNAVLRL